LRIAEIEEAEHFPKKKKEKGVTLLRVWEGSGKRALLPLR